MQQARASRLFSISGLFLVLVLSGTVALQAQDEHRRTKVPLIGRVTGGSNRQAFSGKIQKVDIQRKLLIVDTVEGSSTEYFPVKKDFRVSVPNGKKIKLSELASGTHIIVYFNVNEDRRVVTDILVLGSADGGNVDGESKKKTSPS